MLLDTSESFTLPTLSSAALSCFSVDWKVHRQTDNSDMVTTMPSAFSMGLAEMTLTHTASDIAARKSLFDSGQNYYFEGTVSAEASPTTTS